MKRISFIVALIVALLAVAAPVSASVHVFESDPADLYSLNYANCVEWELNLETGWEISANTLYIHMLDDVTPGVKLGDDNVLAIQNYFDGQGVPITAWEDDVFAGADISYSFKDLGFLDNFSASVPNDGVELTVIGTAVPEPGTMILFALGMVSGVAAYRKKKK